MNASPKKQNQLCLAVMAALLALILVVLSLPIYQFSADIFVKKSPNTFVGDEKYQQALAEVNATAEQYRAEGFAVQVKEAVTERTNSKGEKTSLITFTVNQALSKNGWAFLSSGMLPARMLLALLACLLLAIGCAAAGVSGSLDTPFRQLDRRSRLLRRLSAVLSFGAALLTPAFVMACTYTFSRRVSLYNGGSLTEGRELFLEQLNRFLFAGQAADAMEDILGNLGFASIPTVWLVGLLAFAMAVAGIKLAEGAIQKGLARGLLYVFVAALCVFVLYPYYVMLITAFRSNAETTDIYFQHLLPVEWRFGNLGAVIEKGVLRYLFNSFLIAGGATLIALICGIPAAYSMARMRFKGKKLFLGFVIMSQMFSPVVLLIGIAQLMSTLNLNDSIFGLMLIDAAFNQAFAIWLLRGTFVAISPEMEQAARIDGCSVAGSLWHVLLPMAAPGIVTTLIFVFINTWNEYTISTVLISTPANRPITVGITQFSSFNMIEWQYLFAASLLATIPVVILFMCIEKHLTAGLTSGGVKG